MCLAAHATAARGDTIGVIVNRGADACGMLVLQWVTQWSDVTAHVRPRFGVDNTVFLQLPQALASSRDDVKL